MQYMTGLIKIVLMSRCRRETVSDSGSRINTDMRLHSKVPVIAFLGLMHLRVTLTGFVFGRTRSLNNGGINQRAFFEQDTGFRQPLVHLFKNLAS